MHCLRMIETLNIFKVTEDIVRLLTSDKIVDNMPTIWRHLLYPKMIDVALEMHSLIYYANTLVDERAEYLKRYLGQLERLRSLTRIAHERRILTHGQDAMLQEMYESVGKQAAAWRKKSKIK